MPVSSQGTYTEEDTLRPIRDGSQQIKPGHVDLFLLFLILFPMQYSGSTGPWDGDKLTEKGDSWFKSSCDLLILKMAFM